MKAPVESLKNESTAQNVNEIKLWTVVLAAVLMKAPCESTSSRPPQYFCVYIWHIKINFPSKVSSRGETLTFRGQFTRLPVVSKIGFLPSIDKQLGEVILTAVVHWSQVEYGSSQSGTVLPGGTPPLQDPAPYNSVLLPSLSNAHTGNFYQPAPLCCLASQLTKFNRFKYLWIPK